MKTKIILESVLPILLLLPLTIIFIKDKSHFKTIGLFSLIFILYQIILSLPIEYVGLQIIKGKWNWTGKMFGIIFGILSYILLQKKLKPFNFLRIRQEPKSLMITILTTSIIICITFFSYFDTSKIFDRETLLFQLTMPGFDEEIMFRALLLGLLLTCLKGKIKIGERTFGNPSVLIIGLLFGLVHGLKVTNNFKFEFELYSFLWTFIFGYTWSWITIESKSILQPIISHNLTNFLQNLIRMIK